MKIVQDVRAIPREHTSLRARITLNHGVTTIACLVRNFSYAGANLMLAHPEALPSEFELHIPLRETSYRVALVWHNDDCCGVKFLRKLPPRDPDAAFTDR
jgi:hypothetical protein